MTLPASTNNPNNNDFKPKFVQRIFVTSLIVFLVAWLIPILPFRPKRIEDYLAIYRIVFGAFRTWSMISTAFTTIVILLYFSVTGAYNWRRQYSQSTQTQKAEQSEENLENEQLWSEIRKQKIKKRKHFRGKLDSGDDVKSFLDGIKVFEYLEEASLKQISRGAQLKNVNKGEFLTVKRADLAFVTTGSFKSTFIDSLSKANGLVVTCTSGKTLTSYSNVMRAFARFYNKSCDLQNDLTSIKTVAQEDSQVLIINEKCFRELAESSKLSVAHLTQVILSRFKRATIPIVFDYFNMSGFASSFLGYFIKKSQGFNDVKLTELLNTFQETIKSEEKLLKVILQYLIGTFSLEHSEFIPMETSLSLLKNHIQIKTSNNPNEVIQEIGEECKGAFLVLEGKLRLSFSGGSDAKFIEASVGDFVGIISSLMGKCSSIQVKSNPVNFVDSKNNPNNSHITTYAVISQHLLEMISERDPKILFANIPDNKNTSQFIEFLDMCIDWQQLECGESVETEQDGTKLIVKVLHGRVRECRSTQHQRELGSGSFLGEQEIFNTHILTTQSESTCNFFTVRQTEITTFPVELIEGLVTANAEVATSLLPKLLARNQGGKESISVDPIKTICLLPVGIDARMRIGTSGTFILRDRQKRMTEEVSEYLQRALKRHQITLTVIDSIRATELMGRQLFTTLGTLKMNEFLSSQEDVSKLIIYVADGIFSNWTRQCISQADLVLLMADLDDDLVSFGDLERQMLQMNPLINVEMCLVSGSHNRHESRKWINHRPWVKAHYQLKIPGHGNTNNQIQQQQRHRHQRHQFLYNNIIPMDLFNNLLSKSRDLWKQQQQNIFQRRGSIFKTVEGEDEIELLGFGRLGRRILGRSIGLVLGGGGARGLAHLGIFKAFHEAGIQVDLIGGTSIGAFIGGLLAREGLSNYQRILQSVENFCRAMSSKWRQALDLTYPATSWFTGHAFNRALWKHFSFSGIEDFLVPFFAVTTDLTRSRLQVHRAGPAWKYIRASMSLSGFLPPVCDARDGTLLVDGGYLANVPIELMLNGSLSELSELSVKNDLTDEGRDALSASIVIAIDVGRASDRLPIYYGDSLNGWTVLAKKLLQYYRFKPPSSTMDVLLNPPLTLDEIQFRLAYASSAGLLSRTLKRSHVQLAAELNSKDLPYVTVEAEDAASGLPKVIYLRPGGVQQFGTLEFNKYSEIIKIGYEYGRKLIEEWRESGLLKNLLSYQGVKEQQQLQESNEDVKNYKFESETTIMRCRRSSI